MINKVGQMRQFQNVQRDTHDFMRFLFYFWSFAEIADIYFVWFYELLETRKLLILPTGFLTSGDMPWCEGEINSSHEIHLANQILAMNKKLAEAKTPQAKNMLQRQIEATDKQIDQMVYKFYDLTCEEVGDRCRVLISALADRGDIIQV